MITTAYQGAYTSPANQGIPSSNILEQLNQLNQNLQQATNLLQQIISNAHKEVPKPTFSTSVSATIIEDPVHESGPPHAPVFRCPITLHDGTRGYGPAGSSKSMAKTLAESYVQQLEAGHRGTYHKPIPQLPYLQSALCVVLRLASVVTTGDINHMHLESVNPPPQASRDTRNLPWYDLYGNLQQGIHNIKHDLELSNHERVDADAKSFALQHRLQYDADRLWSTQYDNDQKPIHPRLYSDTPLGPTNREMHAYNGNMASKQKKRQMEKQIAKKVERKIVRDVNPHQRQQKPKRKKQGKNAKKKIAAHSKISSDGLNSMVMWRNPTSVVDHFPLRREKVAEVTCNTAAFLLQGSYVINPGNSVLFPIFSGIAACYESYVIRFLRFVYETTSYTSVAGNPSAGLVLMQCEYDVDDASPLSKNSMENYAGSVKGPPYARRMAVNYAKSNEIFKKHYVYNAPNVVSPLTNAGKFYDGGIFNIATSGNATSGNTIGELYVEYAFTMYTAKQPELAVTNLFAHLVEGANATASAAAPFGTTGPILGNLDSLNPVPSGTTYFTLPYPGDFLIFMLWNNNAVDITAAASIGIGANVSQVLSYKDYTNSSFATGCPAGQKTHVYTTYVRVSTAGTTASNRVTVTGGLTGLTTAYCDVYILPYSPYAQYEVDGRNKHLYLRSQKKTVEQILVDDDKQNQRIAHLEETIRKLDYVARTNMYARLPQVTEIKENDGIISESEYDGVEDHRYEPTLRVPTPREPPRRGPTNKEMHSLNGNGERLEEKPPPLSTTLHNSLLATRDLSQHPRFLEIVGLSVSGIDFAVGEDHLPRDLWLMVLSYVGVLGRISQLTSRDVYKFIKSCELTALDGLELTNMLHGNVFCPFCETTQIEPSQHHPACDAETLIDDYPNCSATCSSTFECGTCGTHHIGGMCEFLHECPCSVTILLLKHWCNVSSSVMTYNLPEAGISEFQPIVGLLPNDYTEVDVELAMNINGNNGSYTNEEDHEPDEVDEDYLQAKFESLNPEVEDSSSVNEDVLRSPTLSIPNVSPKPPISSRPAKERCSECGAVMFWNTKRQQYMCPACTRRQSTVTKSVVAIPERKRSNSDVTYSNTLRGIKRKAKSGNSTPTNVTAAVARQEKERLRDKRANSAKNRKITRYVSGMVGKSVAQITEKPVVEWTPPPPKEPTYGEIITEMKDRETYHQHQLATEQQRPQVIYHSLTQCLTVIGNNENRKMVSSMSEYVIDAKSLERYIKDENGDVVYSKGTYSSQHRVMLPTTMVDECVVFYLAHNSIDEKVIDIARSWCVKETRLLGNSAEELALAVMWVPLVAYWKIRNLQPLLNPFNKLPYACNGGIINQLEIIDHSLDMPLVPVKTRCYIDRNHRTRPRREQVGNDDYLPGLEVNGPPTVARPKFGLLERMIDTVKRVVSRVKKYGELTQLKKHMEKEGVIVDWEQHKLLSERTMVNARSSYKPTYKVMRNYEIKPFCLSDDYYFSGALLEPPCAKLFYVESTISGTHGSWTREDDHNIYNHVTTTVTGVPPQKDKAGFWYPYFDKFSHKKYDVEQQQQHAYLWNHAYRPVCYANNIINERATVANRVTVATPQPDEELLREFIAWAKNNFGALVNFKFCNIQPVSDETYLSRTNATPEMKRKWQDTRDEMETLGLRTTTIGKKLAWLYSTRKLFLKKENLPYRTPLGLKTKCARAIQGLKTLHYLVLLGPWFMSLQDHFKTIWGKDNWTCFTSGVDAVDSAQVLNEFWTIVEDDVGTFDSSVHYDLGEFEVWIAKKFGASETILQLMRSNNKTHGITMLGGKYWMPGGRKSGDPFTSLFNSILNVLLHCFILYKTKGWSVRDMKANLRMLVAGDDNLMTLNSSAPDFKMWMAKLGFNSEAVVRKSLDEAEYCSCRLYFIQGKWVFGPMPGKVLSKLGFINSPPANVTRESMLRGIAIGLIRACIFLPPVVAVARRILELTEGHNAYFGYATRFKEEFWHMHFDYSQFDSHFNPAVYASLYSTYGWTICMQRELENFMSTFQLDQEITDNNYLRILFDRDTSGPQVMAA
jgi:hypothetical protein